MIFSIFKIILAIPLLLVAIYLGREGLSFKVEDTQGLALKIALILVSIGYIIISAKLIF